MHALIAVMVVVQQLQFLPAGPPVRGGLADPREPRDALGLIVTDLFADALRNRPTSEAFPVGQDLAHDTHGIVELGINFPILGVGRVIVSLQGGLISRFRLDAHDNDHMSSDYMVALPFNYERGNNAVRIRLIHRSGHLGDELVFNTTIRRLEYDHEEIDVMVAHRIGGLRFYGNGSITTDGSYTQDKHGFQLGADGRWRVSERVKALGGVDWEKHSIAEGPSQTSVTGGLEAGGMGGTIRVLGLFHRGQSSVGEFFYDKETYWGFTVVFAPGTRSGR